MSPFRRLAEDIWYTLGDGAALVGCKPNIQPVPSMRFNLAIQYKEESDDKAGPLADEVVVLN
jgi:hypothetical protein